jgi:hypothetical protein
MTEEETDISAQMQRLIDDHPEVFAADALMRYFFREVLGRARALDDPDIVQDPEFRRLIAVSLYANLPAERRNRKLYEKAERLIERLLSRHDPGTDHQQ